MSEARAQSLFSIVRQSADADAVAAMEALVRNAPDHELCRVNVLDFATKRGLNEERVIAAFLHAARVGIFELSWNVLCPGCGGVLDATATLRNVHKENYECALCAAGYEPTLDEMVEVTFTVSPQVRRIAAHDPNTLSIWDYFRQIFWSSGVDLPADFRPADRRDHHRCGRAPARRAGADLAAIAGGVRDRVRAGDTRGTVPRCKGRADPRAPGLDAHLQQGPRAHRDHGDCGRDRCGFRSTTAPTCACCRRCGSPATCCMTCSASGSRS